MSDKQMLTVLRHAEIKPKDWSAKGPEGSLTVLEHTRAIPDSMDSGTITFKVKTADNTELTLVGMIAPGGAESVTRDGVSLPGGAVDGGVAAHTVIRGFKIRIETVVIVKLLADGPGEDDEVEYRFEGKFGKTSVPMPPLPTSIPIPDGN